MKQVGAFTPQPVTRRSRRRRAAVLAVFLGLLLVLPACKRAPSAPEEIPEVRMSLNLRGQLASQVIQIVTGAAGYQLRWTPEALKAAERKAVTIQVQNTDWQEILNQTAGDAKVEWDWKKEDGVWVIWVHMPGDRWRPESGS